MFASRRPTQSANTSTRQSPIKPSDTQPPNRAATNYKTQAEIRSKASRFELDRTNAWRSSSKKKERRAWWVDTRGYRARCDIRARTNTSPTGYSRLHLSTSNFLAFLSGYVPPSSSRPPPCLLISFFFHTHTRIPSSFWTSRGHKCRPFFPLVLAFIFYRA